MLAEPRMGFSETFLVWNDDINLIGALIPSNNGRASVCGTIRFKNGERLSFSSKSDDCKISHQKFMSLCQCIAKFYGTKVIHRKGRIADSAKKTSVLFKKEPPLLNWYLIFVSSYIIVKIPFIQRKNEKCRYLITKEWLSQNFGFAPTNRHSTLFINHLGIVFIFQVLNYATKVTCQDCILAIRNPPFGWMMDNGYKSIL